MRSVLDEDFESFDLPPLPEVNFDESESVPILSPLSESNDDLSEQVSFLEKRRNTLITTLSNLTQKVKSQRQVYNSHKDDLDKKICHVKSLIEDLQEKKTLETNNLSLISVQQKRLASTLNSLDSEKQSLLRRESLISDKVEDLNSKLVDVTTKEKSLSKLNSALLDKEKRLILKEHDLDSIRSNSSSKLGSLDKASKELRQKNQDLSQKESDLGLRENVLAQKLSALKLSHIHFLNEKNEFEKKNKTSLDHLKKIAEKETILKASITNLSLREDEINSRIKKNAHLISHLGRKEQKIDSLMLKLSSSKGILADTKKRHTDLLKEVKLFEKEVETSKKTKLGVESEIFHLEHKLRTLENDIRISSIRHKEDDSFIKTQKSDLDKLNKELSLRQLDLKKKEVLIDTRSIEIEQKQIRITGLESQVSERETFFVKQKEDLVKEETRVQALVTKHAGIAEKISELEIHERDMNLKILSFEKREEALQSLETVFKNRERDLIDKESNSETLQLTNKINTLSSTISSLETDKETLSKTITDLESSSTKTSTESTELLAEKDALASQIKGFKTEVAKLKSDLETSTISEEALRKETEQLHKSLYDVGSRNVQFIDKDEDVQKVLKITDDLLEHLPEDTLKKFVESDDFHIFEKVFKKYNIE